MIYATELVTVFDSWGHTNAFCCLTFLHSYPVFSFALNVSKGWASSGNECGWMTMTTVSSDFE